jgi:RNA polymerase sigma-70 factor (ECF subfamily)
MSRAATDHELARVVREHAGQLAASLVRLIGDFAAAEDLVQDAVEAALEHWPHEGIPSNPGGWLYIVARRRGLDVLRRDARYRDKLALMQWPIPSAPDDRLRLVFTCCHPALPRAAQVALTLRVVCGLTSAQIAKAFLVPETTVAQRITRAKQKIANASIPYRIPADDELGGRMAEVLAVIYLLFNEAYLSTGGEQVASRDLADDAEFLAGLLHTLMPTEPEVIGLLALSSDSIGPGRLLASTTKAGSSSSPIRTGRAGTTPRSWTRSVSSPRRPVSSDPPRTSSKPPSWPVTPRHRRGTTPTGSRSCCSTPCSTASRRPR